MRFRVGIHVVLCQWLLATTIVAADFDGDGVVDEFEVTRIAVALRRAKDARVVDPWNDKSASRPTREKSCLFVRLSREPRSYLISSDFFSSPVWDREPRPLKIIRTKDRAYARWKKNAPGMKGDGIQLGTEAGIDILLYWNGQHRRVYEPAEDP